jgi:hypothetical protein
MKVVGDGEVRRQFFDPLHGITITTSWGVAIMVWD